MKGRLVKELVTETPALFHYAALPSNQEEFVDDMIERYKKEGKMIHVIRGSEAEIKKIAALLERSEERPARKVDDFRCSCKTLPHLN